MDACFAYGFFDKDIVSLDNCKNAPVETYCQRKYFQLQQMHMRALQELV